MGQRLAALGSGIVDTFLRENRVLPPVLALFALLVFAWIVAGIFVGGPDEERRALNEANLAQSEDAPGSDPLAPEVENRNVESYAAYQSKDPFRQLLTPAGETTAPTTTPEDTVGETTTGGGGGGGLDTDGDGLSDTRESELGLDPFNPDTDGDGTPDGDESAGGGGGGRGGGGGGGGGLDTDGDGLSDTRESELGLDPFNPDTDGDGTPDGDESAGGGGGGLFDSGGGLRLP